MGDKIGACKCSCGDCCGGGLTEDDLPTITITGMTGSGWSEIEGCCSYQDFTYNTPQSISLACDEMMKAEVTQSCEDDVYAEEKDPPNTCPPTLCPTYFVIGTEKTEKHTTKRWNLVVSYRRKRIRVTLARALVTCEGVETCKFILRVDVIYEMGYAVAEDQIEWNYREAVPTASCFVVKDNADCGYFGTYPVPSFNCASQEVPPFTLEDSFYRYKLYDTMPTGTTNLTLTADDFFPSGCTLGSACFVVGTLITDICLNYSTPIDEPEYCDWDATPDLVECDRGSLSGTENWVCYTDSWDGENCTTGITNGNGDPYTCDPFMIWRFDSFCGWGCGSLRTAFFSNDCELVTEFTTAGCYWTTICNPTNYARYQVMFRSVSSYTIDINCTGFTTGTVCFGVGTVSLTMVV